MNVRKDVTHDYAGIARAQSASGFHEFAIAHRQHLSSHQARVTHPSADDEREDQVPNSGSQESNEGNCQKNPRERKKRIHHHDVEEAIELAAVVAGDRSEEDAERKRTDDHAAAHQHGDP